MIGLSKLSACLGCRVVGKKEVDLICERVSFRANRQERTHGCFPPALIDLVWFGRGAEIQAPGTSGTQPAGWPAGATPIQWSADGAALFYALSSHIPGEIHRFDLATGRSQVWQQLAPGDLGGVQTITSPVITPDGHVYAYTFARLLGDLYVADWGSR